MTKDDNTNTPEAHLNPDDCCEMGQETAEETVEIIDLSENQTQLAERDQVEKLKGHGKDAFNDLLSVSSTTLPETRLGQTTSDGSSLPPAPPALRRNNRYQVASQPGAVAVSPQVATGNAASDSSESQTTVSRLEGTPMLTSQFW